MNDNPQLTKPVSLGSGPYMEYSRESDAWILMIKNSDGTETRLGPWYSPDQMLQLSTVLEAEKLAHADTRCDFLRVREQGEKEQAQRIALEKQVADEREALQEMCEGIRNNCRVCMVKGIRRTLDGCSQCPTSRHSDKAVVHLKRLGDIDGQNRPRHRNGVARSKEKRKV